VMSGDRRFMAAIKNWFTMISQGGREG
jgi:hypothetical protein